MMNHSPVTQQKSRRKEKMQNLKLCKKQCLIKGDKMKNAKRIFTRKERLTICVSALLVLCAMMIFSTASPGDVHLGATNLIEGDQRITGMLTAGTVNASAFQFYNGTAIGQQGPAGSNGANGANGATWFTGSGSPSTGLGSVGDNYFRTDNGWTYNKTGASTWTYTANLTGLTGATGPSGGGGSGGGQLVYTYFIFSNATATYMQDSAGSIPYSNTNSMSVLQNAVGNCSVGSVIQVKSPFVAYGTLQVTKALTLKTDLLAAYDGSGVTDLIFNSGLDPLIEKINITVGSTAALSGFKLSGFCIQELNIRCPYDKWFSDALIENCYFYTNTTNHGIRFSGNVTNPTTGFIDSVVFRQCRFLPEDNEGLTYGMFTFGDYIQHITHFALEDCVCDMSTSNTTVFLNDGSAQVDQMQLTNFRMYTSSSLADLNMFYVKDAKADNVQTMEVDWDCGFIESHSNLALINIPDDSGVYHRMYVRFSIHDLSSISGTEGGTVTLMTNAQHDWYNNDWQIFLFNNRIDGSFSLGTAHIYRIGVWRVGNNFGYNSVGYVNHAVVEESGFYTLLDSGGTLAIPSGQTVTVSQSDAWICGNSTTTTVTGMQINGQSVAAVLPIYVKAGDTFNITYSGGVPVVIKK